MKGNPASDAAEPVQNAGFQEGLLHEEEQVAIILDSSVRLMEIIAPIYLPSAHIHRVPMTMPPMPVLVAQVPNYPPNRRIVDNRTTSSSRPSN